MFGPEENFCILPVPLIDKLADKKAYPIEIEDTNKINITNKIFL